MMEEPQTKVRRPRYLIKHDILNYYYNTYIGLAVVFMLLVFLKVDVFPWQADVVFLVIVLARIIYGVVKLAPTISCPFCEAGHKKRDLLQNAYYLSTLPLEKEVFECPSCGKEIEIVDKDW